MYQHDFNKVQTVLRFKFFKTLKNNVKIRQNRLGAREIYQYTLKSELQRKISDETRVEVAYFVTMLHLMCVIYYIRLRFWKVTP